METYFRSILPEVLLGKGVAAYFRTSFLKNTYEGLFLIFVLKISSASFFYDKLLGIHIYDKL